MKRYISILSAVLFAACAKEVLPERGNETLRTETLKARIETTKVDVSDAGKFSWSEGDEIAVHRSVNGYETVVLKDDGYFNVHLAEGEARDGYAVYPASAAEPSAPEISVNLPAAYSIPRTGMGTSTPIPMIAVNDPESDDLYFHHLGGILRLELKEVPYETQRIIINLGKKVTGVFPVEGLDTQSPFISLTDAPAEDIVFTATDPITTTQPVILNIPVPVGTYESLSYTLYDRYDNLVSSRTEDIFVTIERANGYQMGAEVQPDLLTIPLCIKLARNGTLKVHNPLGLTIEYSFVNSPNDENWTAFSGDMSWDLRRGQCIYFRGENRHYAECLDSGYSSSNYNFTSMECNVKSYIYGNIMSLITPYPEDYSILTELPDPSTFAYLFTTVDKESGVPDLGALLTGEGLQVHPTLDLLLPATTLTPHCYEGMFYYCVAGRPIKLPATNLTEGCYKAMFLGTRLTRPTELPATTLAPFCYEGMFQESDLKEVPTLPATELAEGCYRKMFASVSELESIPELPATTLAPSCYEDMFMYCRHLTVKPVLPATVLAASCYYGMFAYCSSLADAPELPVEELAPSCYSSMFTGCTSMVSPPVLSSQTLASYCYAHMFQGCSSLASAPVLPATTLASGCYSSMFAECTSLTAGPALLSTELADRCYLRMFSRCPALETAPDLPAEDLKEFCYEGMFEYCSALETAPALPSETMETGCYYSMFFECSSLLRAPDLPALTLTDRCYQWMFYNCTSLNYVKAMFTSADSNYLNGWLSGVSTTGTYVMNASATYDPVTDVGVPGGWTIDTATE